MGVKEHAGLLDAPLDFDPRQALRHVQAITAGASL